MVEVGQMRAGLYVALAALCVDLDTLAFARFSVAGAAPGARLVHDPCAPRFPSLQNVARPLSPAR